LRTYEVLFITRPDYDDEKVAEVMARYQETIKSANGIIKTLDKWGKRRLAYEIDGLREGLYILLTFDGPTALAKELDRLMKIDPDVVRHMISRIDGLTRQAKPKRVTAQPEETKVKEEEGVPPARVVKADDKAPEKGAERAPEEPSERPAAKPK